MLHTTERTIVPRTVIFIKKPNTSLTPEKNMILFCTQGRKRRFLPDDWKLFVGSPLIAFAAAGELREGGHCEDIVNILLLAASANIATICSIQPSFAPNTFLSPCICLTPHRLHCLHQPWNLPLFSSLVTGAHIKVPIITMESLFYQPNLRHKVIKFVSDTSRKYNKINFWTGGWCSKLALFSFHYCRIANITLSPHSQ